MSTFWSKHSIWIIPLLVIGGLIMLAAMVGVAHVADWTPIGIVSAFVLVAVIVALFSKLRW
jgi:hypothetical protein